MSLYAEKMHNWEGYGKYGMGGYGNHYGKYEFMAQKISKPEHINSDIENCKNTTNEVKK